MEKFGKSQSTRRFEDRRFLTGAGRYVDDIAPEGALHGVFVRSEIAHGSFAPLDLSDVREMDGVKLALAVEDLEAMGIAYTLDGTTVTNRDGSEGADVQRPILAKGKVRFVGDPIALIVAETKAQAVDAAEAVFADFDELGAKIDMAPGGDTIHAEAPDNVAFDWQLGDQAAVTRAIAGAAHVVKTRVVDNRVIVNSMEPRGCTAEWGDDRLHVAFGGQGVWGMKTQLAKCLGIDKAAVRVTNPDVGGGFGMKAMAYPEYFALAVAARALGKPVHWMSGRTEAMLSDNGGRDLISDTTLAFDENHKMVAYQVDTICNMGAYNSGYAQPIQTELFSKVASGVYDVQNIVLNCLGYYTTTAQLDAYRGAGRPEAIFALERSMDNAARELGVDPGALRRKSFIKPEQFPYQTALAGAYDVGEFDAHLDAALANADHAGFAARKAASSAKGMLRGQGMCFYIESILGATKETSRVRFEDDGSVSLFVGTQSNGQGHETVYAQFLSDQSGIPVDAINIVQGDSDLIPTGGGTGGSRSVTMQSTATLATVATVTEKFAAYLGEKFDAEGVDFDDERFRIPGSNETPTMLEVAEMARADAQHEILDTSEEVELENRSYPYGVHLAEIEIDPGTGQIRVDRYSVTDDFGNLINPMLAEGQVHGGVAQGLGQALTEHTVYDEDGQLLTATFMDYGMPRADDMPMIGFATECVPSIYNPMGMKGCGEAGTVGALAAIANAVADATGGIEIDMPFTPSRVWAALNGAKIAAE